MKQIADEELVAIEENLVSIADIVERVRLRPDISVTLPTAGFTADKLSGNTPLTVKFVNLSKDSVSFVWSVDGIVISNVSEPTYTFSTVGKHTVSLTATNAFGSDIETKFDYITVTSPITPSQNVVYMDKLSLYGLSPLTYGINVNEGPKIQAGLDYAKQKGYPVEFPIGKTIYNSSRLIFPAGVTVTGNGCLIKRINGTGVRDYQTANVYGTVKNLKFAGTDAGWVQGTNDGACGVYVFSGGIVDGCEVYRFCAYSLSVYQGVGMHDIQIKNNIVRDSLQYGICTGPGDPPVGNTGIIVTGNTISNCKEVGIKIRGVNSATIQNNTVAIPAVSSARGIALYSYDGPNYNVVIDKNVVAGVGQGTGIESDAGGINQNITVSNNSITNCARSMVLPNITNLTKVGNTCNGSPC